MFMKCIVRNAERKKLSKKVLVECGHGHVLEVKEEEVFDICPICELRLKKGKRNMIKRIFLDMDGVLCNFVHAVSNLFGMTEEELYRKWEPGVYDVCNPLGISDEEMWKVIETQGKGHWANLKPFSWTQELWELCNSYAPTVILTSPSRDPQCLAGKVEWMNEHLGNGEPFRKFLIGPVKEFCAAPGHILIDDSGEKCSEFYAGGGFPITFPQIWNIKYNEVNRKIEYVKETLDYYVKTS